MQSCDRPHKTSSLEVQIYKHFKFEKIQRRHILIQKQMTIEWMFMKPYFRIRDEHVRQESTLPPLEPPRLVSTPQIN